MEDLKTIVNALGPGTGEQLYWDIALYLIFFFNIMVLLLDGSSLGTNVSILVLLSTMIDKVFAFGYMFDPGRYTPEYYHAKIFIGTYLIRVVMFAGPFFVAGSTKKKKARTVAVLAGGLAVAYMLARWYFDQYGVTTTRIF